MLQKDFTAQCASVAPLRITCKQRVCAVQNQLSELLQKDCNGSAPFCKILFEVQSYCHHTTDAHLLFVARLKPVTCIHVNGTINQRRITTVTTVVHSLPYLLSTPS